MSAMPAPPRQKRPAWFWIAICAGAGAVIILALIVAAIAIPNMLSTRKHANQTAAVESLRTIAAAESEYLVAYSSYACGLDTGSAAHPESP